MRPETAPRDELDVLRDPGASLADTLAAIDGLEARSAGARELRIGVSANVTAEQLGTFLRKHALLHGLVGRVAQGGYDAHLENVRTLAERGAEQLVLLNFLDNLLPAFEARVGDAELVAARREQLAGELRLALADAAGYRTVWLTLFHAVSPGAAAVAADFNDTLREVAAEFANVRTVALEPIAAALGTDRAFDPRFYHRFKAPYTPAFWDELARRIFLASRGAETYFHKALVLDCDNTLWGGVVGEDLLEGIRLGPHDYPGNVFWRVQQAFAALQREGVLLCLCTKNNPADVEEVLASHPHQVLRAEHFVVRRVNWEDKVDNLIGIADELGIGLDSLVFVDDSPFECAAVRERLPMVRVFDVPRQAYEYPAVAQEISDLFLAGPRADGAADKTEQYRRRALAVAEESRHATREEYLHSLGVEVFLRRDDPLDAPRVAELTQKSNQFNLTTRRHTEAEIRAFVDSPRAGVYALDVADRFGAAGLTGVAIVLFEGEAARVETFLMSCRVIGSGIEDSPWEAIAAEARARGCARLEADYLPTPKNGQVAGFFDRLGLDLVSEEEGARRYAGALAALDVPVPDHITVHHG